MEDPKPIVRAFVGIVAVLIIGTTGYHLIEGWSLLESLYMTVITVTTIGYGEVQPLSDAGRIFTLFVICSGIGTGAYLFVTGSRFLIEGEVEKIFTRRRSMKAIRNIRDHFIVCGYGRMGSFVCHEFHARGIPFVVVEVQPEVQDRIVQAGYFLAPGDATEEDVLIAANIKYARGLVSVLDSDASNVYVVLTARELNPTLEIIARAAEEPAQKKLVRAGANRVISPYQIGGMRMVMGILKPTVMNFIEMAMDHRHLNIELEEVRVASGSAYGGKRLVDTGIRGGLDLIIIAVKKKDGTMVFNPGPYTVIEDEDTLIAMGEKDCLAVLAKKAGASV